MIVQWVVSIFCGLILAAILLTATRGECFGCFAVECYSSASCAPGCACLTIEDNGDAGVCVSIN